ncbi:MAG: hypothetical protein WC536_01115 [Patescibacteria group bacterium]
MRNGNKDQLRRGQRDEFLRFVKGFDAREKATRDGTQLFIETNRFKDELYPPLTKPAGRPGYVTYNSDYFDLENKNAVLRSNLMEYFLENESRIYSGANDLAQFFEFSFFGILVDHFSAYFIEWKQQKVNNSFYILPTFHHLDGATIKIRKKADRLRSVKHSYSLWTYLANKEARPKTTIVGSEDIFLVEYPFSKESPTQQSSRELSVATEFLQFSVNQSLGWAEPDNHSLGVERARHITFQEVKRRQDISRGRIRKKFNHLYQEGSVTNYYDIYICNRYSKFLNDIRNYLIEQFNTQILEEIRKRNGFKSPIRLGLKEDIFIKNEDLESAWTGFQAKKISVDEYVKRAIKKY